MDACGSYLAQVFFLGKGANVAPASHEPTWCRCRRRWGACCPGLFGPKHFKPSFPVARGRSLPLSAQDYAKLDCSCRSAGCSCCDCHSILCDWQAANPGCWRCAVPGLWSKHTGGCHKTPRLFWPSRILQRHWWEGIQEAPCLRDQARSRSHDGSRWSVGAECLQVSWLRECSFRPFSPVEWTRKQCAVALGRCDWLLWHWPFSLEGGSWGPRQLRRPIEPRQGQHLRWHSSLRSVGHLLLFMKSSFFFVGWSNFNFASMIYSNFHSMIWFQPCAVQDIMLMSLNAACFFQFQRCLFMKSWMLRINE